MDPNAESDVRRLVGLSKLGEALQVGLAAAAAEGDDAAREAALKMLMQVLTATRDDAEIAKAVGVLDPASCDLLMKWTYKGLAKGDAQLSAALFKWHEALTKKEGEGCILRALTGAAV